MLIADRSRPSEATEPVSAPPASATPASILYDSYTRSSPRHERIERVTWDGDGPWSRLSSTGQSKGACKVSTITRPRCLEELAGRLYEASDGAQLAAQQITATGAAEPLREMQEARLYLHDVSCELEMLGDYVYGLTRRGASLRGGA